MNHKFKAFIGAVLLIPAMATAQSWPTGPVTVIVPFPPGGVTDITARIVARQLEQELGQSFVVDNRPGAGGNIGSAAASRAAADGYTLLYATQGVLTANEHLYGNTGYNVQRDFVPIGQTYETAHVLTVGPRLKVNTAQEFLERVRAEPGKITYGSAGVGGGTHLFTEYMAHAAKLEMLHVPYKGSGPAMTDLVGGQIDSMLDTIPSAYGQIQAGNLRALAVSSPQRDPSLPNVPTLAESGIPNFEVMSWGALMARTGTPPDTLKAMTAALNKVLNSPETRKQLADRGATAAPATPEATAERIASESKRWAVVIKEAGIKSQ